MRGNGLLAAWMVGVVSCSGIFADDAIDSLSVIPGEAMAFVCIPNPQALDADIQTSITKLGLGGMVPLPGNSVLSMLEAQAPPLQKMDANKPLAVVVMPADTLPGLNKSQAMLIPCDDPESIIQEFNGQQADNGSWTVNVFGTELQADVRQKHLILAERAELVQGIKKSSKTMGDLLPAPVRMGMADLDLIIGLNLAKLSSLVEPLIESRLFPILESQAESSLEKQSVEINKRQIKQLLEGMETMIIGLRLEESGLAFRLTGSVKAGSELSKSTHMRVTDESLLKGLPSERWSIVSGQVADEMQMQAQFDNLQPMLEAFKSSDGVDESTLASLQDTLKKWLLGSRGYQMSLTPLSENSDGVVGICMVVHCQDSQQWLQQTEEAIRLGRELASTADNEATEFLNAFSVTTSDGIVVMEIDMSQLDAIDEDQQEMIAGVLGSEAILRMKAVGPDRVLMSFGGGVERLAELEQGMAKNGDPQSAGINDISEFLPAQRNSVTYVFVDQTVELVRRVLMAMDEEDLPFPTPQVDVPIAVTATGGENWWRADFVVPMDVISAGRDIAMTMLGQ